MKKLLSILAVVIAIAFTANAQKIGIQASVGLPMGDFKDVADAKTGFGGTGTYFYEAEGAFMITGSIGFLSFSTDPDKGSYMMIPVMAGARYAFSEGNFMPYAGAEAGYSIFSFSASGGGTAVSNNNIGLAPMLGFMMEMSKGLNLDVNAKYNMILTSGSTTSYLGVNAGVVFEL